MRKALGLAGAAALFLTGAAHAQDYRAAPTDLAPPTHTGFYPDPYIVILEAGGPIAAADTLSPTCAGFIENAPDFRLSFQTDGRLPLIFKAESDADTVLIIAAPDGRWTCDDDSGDGLNPMIRFNTPQSGQYDVWVGSFRMGETPTARLIVTELTDQVSPQ